MTQLFKYVGVLDANKRGCDFGVKSHLNFRYSAFVWRIEINYSFMTKIISYIDL